MLLVVGLAVVGAVAPAGAAADGWDPRIADIARDVEQLRGLEFDHPVRIEVLGDRAFERRYLAESKPTARDREEWSEIQDAFEAMGLMDAPIDLDTLLGASGTNVAGYFDPRTEAIVVRGSRIDDPGTRVVLAHELTHALQAQHFPIQALQRRAAKADSMLTKALIEGDATEVEGRYFADLTPREQDAARAAGDASLAEATPLPPFLEAMFMAPYVLGAVTIAVVRALGGQQGLDAIMDEPPTRDLALIDPTAVKGPHEWVTVEPPALERGEQRRGDPFPMDAVGLYLVLAEHLPWTDALAAAERWGGDSAATFIRDGRPCVRIRVAGRHGVVDARAIGDAFRRWAAAGGTDTEVTPTGALTTITLCASGADAAATVSAPPAQAMVGLSIRNRGVAEMVDGRSGRAHV